MGLPSGTRLGAYEILALIGTGGMGEVYRARDTKLGRDVALKLLPDSFTHDPERVARFRREAQVLAALNHPHIAQIHGLDEANGTQFLVLELVDGESLDKRIARGAIAVDEAFDIARQLAEGLEAAHEKGIIHRDLKTANIALTTTGQVKVLDFGLAKPTEAAAGESPALATSPTVTSPAMMTGVGVILGTAAYMAPEQARGNAASKGSDIWAFGCVLYEMLSGRKPFDGETLTDVVACILKNEPDWRALPPGTPPRLQSLIARCLRKQPGQRCRDIADVRFQIEDLLQDSGPAPMLTPSRRARERAAWIAAALGLGVALVLVMRPSISSSPADTVSLQVFPPEGTTFSASYNNTVSIPAFAIAPDGHALAFTAESPGARPMLWVRSIDRVDARQLAGTEGAQSPMWSPDSRWIAFVVDQILKKVPAAGGPVEVITQSAPDFHGGTWERDDTIVFSSGSGPLLRVDASGGPITPVTTMDTSRGETMHRNPDALPDGRHFLYYSGGGDQNGVYAGSLDDKVQRFLLHTNATPVYASPGYLLFVEGDSLMAQGVNTEPLEIRGHTFPVAEHVGRNTTFVSAVSASRTGTIAYAGLLTQKGRLTWVDREGHTLGAPAIPEGDYPDFRLSPDGTRLAASLLDLKTNQVDLWIMDLARGSFSRLESGGPVTGSPIWSPNGAQLIFRTNRSGFVELFERSAGGGGGDRRILEWQSYVATQGTTNNLVSTDWSRDGKHIMLSARRSASGTDLWLLSLEENARAVPFITSPSHNLHGNFSPTRDLLAYSSNESGRFDVYVDTIPRSDRRWPVSTSGGYEPRWRSDGRELYYLSEDRTLMAVEVGDGPSFGVPKPLFQTHVPPGVSSNRTHYVPSPDGQRFLIAVPTDLRVSPITVVVNWAASLQK